MQPNSLFVFLLLTTVIICLVGSASSIAKIRYVNSMPQFGKATVKSIPPFSVIFNGIPGGALTSYVNFTTLLSVLVTEYPTNVTALSLPYLIDPTKYYSLFTYQIQSRHLANVLVEDRQTSLTATKAALRSINLLQYNFPLDVFNFTNNVQLFDNVTYGVPTAYVAVPPGDYVLYWESSSAKKRDVQQTNTNQTKDPFLSAGFAYTHWVLPSGSFIVRDGAITDPVSTRKRMAASSSVRTRRNNIKDAKEDAKLKSVVKKSTEGKENVSTNHSVDSVELTQKSNRMKEIVENQQLTLTEKITMLNSVQ